MDAKADLHLHTSYSDGALLPAELISRAKEAGLSVIGITDHDTVNAVDEAIAFGREHGIEVVPGVELSASLDDAEIHILGYFINYHEPSLLDALAIFREERLKRVERIVNKLNRMNIPLRLESVLAASTGESVGRPHVAAAMVNGGHAETYYQAFNKYLGDGRPAYEKKMNFTPEETIQLIAKAGGLSFLGHPGHIVQEETVLRMIKAGLDGVEVIHPSHSPDLVQYYRGIVNEYCLLESGGSDFHGGQKGDDNVLGHFTIPLETVQVMRRRLSLQ